MHDFVQYLVEISKLAGEYNLEQHKYLIQKLSDMAQKAHDMGKEGFERKITNFSNRFCSFIKEFTVFAYNGGGYDLPILTSCGLFHYLRELDGPDLTVMRDKQAFRYMMIKSNSLRFVDLAKYIGAPTSLSNCLSNFGVKEQTLKQLHEKLNPTIDEIRNSGSKLLYPFSIATDYEALQSKDPFKYEDFNSVLSGDNHLSPKHAKFCELLEEGLSEEGACKVLKIKQPPDDPHVVLQMINDIKSRLDISNADFYQLYCETDCVSTLKLAQKLIDEFAKIGVYTVFEKLTVSSISFDHMLRQMDTDEYPNFFTILNKHDHDFVKRAAVGGISTCFNRLMIRDYTPIRFHEYGDDAMKAKTEMIFDVNSMYLSAIGESSQSLGFPMLRKAEDHFKVSRYGPKEPFELIALMYIQDRYYPKETIRTNLSVLGQKKLWLDSPLSTYTPLDGWIEGLRIAISIQGCYYHACANCYQEKWDHEPHPTGRGTFAQVRARSDAIERAIKAHPEVRSHIIVKECELRKEMVGFSNFSSYNAKLSQSLNKEYTVDELIRAIQREEIHGFVELSMKVKESALDAWQAFPPLFCKKTITPSDLDYNMRKYALDNKIMRVDEEREILVPCLEVENAVVSTKLLKFYLDLNIITYRDVKLVLEFHKSDVLKKFRDNLVFWRMQVGGLLFFFNS